jgi:uncharacterized protein YecT (DUF1311 family)
MLLSLLWCVLLAAGCDHDRNEELAPVHEEVAALKAPRVAETFTLLPCPGRPKSTRDHEGCAEHRIVRSDGAINDLNARIFTRLRTERNQTRFVRAERAWLTYRTATCQSRSDGYYGGSVATIVFADCVANINRTHLKELSEFAHDLRSK